MNNGQFQFRFPGIREAPQLIAGTGVPGTKVFFEPGDAGQSQIFTIPLWAGPQSNESIHRQIRAYLRAQARPVRMHGLTADAAKRLMHRLCVREEKRLARKAIAMRDKERRRSGEWAAKEEAERGRPMIADVAQKSANHLESRKRSLLSREAWNAAHIREASGSDKIIVKRAREAAEESDDCRDPGEVDAPPTKRPRPVEDETPASRGAW
ncbi:hypothetical protein CCMSSC00406_0009245 [Pleurotus cornucopiae]|uniref:Uncharacterized protein n=1 Tax=Pleurotus cornucopiae TaxID=5321 RepID=A0ACB7J1A3_PLECO|nr:hypothetical protein CCMSSC00406_0009245 [Pleurotus cornucopiae]